MKVFLVGDFPKDDKTYGGVEGVLVNLTNELILRKELELVLVSTSLNTDFSRFATLCKTYTLNFRNSFITARQKFNEIYNTENPDIIHLQGSVPGVLLYKNEYHKKFIVTQHAILNQERLWQVSLKRSLLFSLKMRIENYYFKKLNNLIFISKYNQDLYFERFDKSESFKHVLIPNPVNTIFFETGSDSVPQKQNEMYFVGEIKKRKGLHVLLRAMHVLKQNGSNSILHVIGGFKELNYKKEILDLLSSLDLTENIVFCGWKNQIEIISYIKNIPVFVLPSFQETLPLSIAEAMCQGKVVVATDICGIPEMIENNKSGYLFPPDDHIELAGVLDKIFQNTELREGFSKKATIASKRYKAENVVNKTIEFYKSIA